MKTIKSWIVNYCRDGYSKHLYIKDSFDKAKKTLKKLGYENYTIQEDLVGPISEQLYKEGGEAEEKLRAKCNWEKRTRCAIIQEYGDPRNWK